MKHKMTTTERFRRISFNCWLLAFFALLPFSAVAEVVNVTVDQLKYEVDTNACIATCIGLIDNETEINDLVISNQVEYDSQSYPVTVIRGCAFRGCENLTGSLTIGNAVRTIEDSAFASCYYMTSVTIPESVADIGRDAFQFCSSLNSIVIEDGDSILNMGPTSFDSRWMFRDSPIKTLYLGRKLNFYTFQEHPTLSEVTIGNKITSIDGTSFEYCRS